MRKSPMIALIVSCGMISGIAQGARVALPQVRMGVGGIRQGPSAQGASPQTFHHVGSAGHIGIVLHPHGHFYGRYGGYGYRNDPYNSAQAALDAATLEALAHQYDPQLLGRQVKAVVVAPAGPMETARAALTRGDAHAAQRAVEALLQSKDVAVRSEAMMLTGFAHVIDREFELAGRSFEKAFEIRSALKTQPLDGKTLLGSFDRLRTLTQRATRHALRKPTREAWFVVAVMVHAQGKENKANQLIERAMSLPIAE